MPTLKKKFREEITPALMKEFNYTSVMQVPRLDKIVLNQGIGQGVADKKIVNSAQEEMTIISGQKAVQRNSRLNISNFKLREGMPIGVKVTLRKDNMYEFLEKLLVVAIPRMKDFRGVPGKLDGRGNYTLGIEEQIIFPEIELDKIDKIMGMNITFVTSAKTDEEGYALLKQFGFPFKK
ncbi:MAG: 50S ribosomal protein L5 [Bacteroidales bacterium]|nr:50S ribosomal protein L5 [Bacteroidales bacterium]